MIKLNREVKPDVLSENEDAWTAELTKAIAEHGNYSELPKEIKDKLLPHYRHQDIQKGLFDSSHQKCAFCETKPGESGNIEVEHFAPKSIYPNLTFSWENLLPSCRKCNGSKGTHDTLIKPIINPYETDPDDVFHYQDIRLAANNNNYKDVGERTIRVCGLNSVRLMKPRANILVSLHAFSESISDAIEDYKQADTPRKRMARRRKLGEAVEIMENLSASTEIFSGFCINYLAECAPFREAKGIINQECA